MAWPHRSGDWEQSLIGRARALFADLAERNSLTLQWLDDEPVDVGCRLSAQPGLDFDVTLALQNADELTVHHDWFWVNIFPADDAGVWSRFERFADGLLNGSAYALVRHCGDPTHPYHTRAMLFDDGKWRPISSGLAPLNWRLFGRRTDVVRNMSGSKAA